MKKKYQIIFVVLLLSFTSCNKDEILDTNIEKPTLDKTELGITVINNVIHFNNEESLKSTVKYLNGLCENERIEWEISHNFISNRSRSYEGYDALLEASDIEQFEDVLKNYSDVLYLDGDEVLQYVDGCGLSSICNPNGNYFIGSVAYKITPEYEYISNNGDISKLDEAAMNLDGSIKGIVAIPRKNVELLKSLSCNSGTWEGSKTYSHPKLTDREVIVEVSTDYEYSLHEEPNFYEGIYTQTVKTISRRKRLGFWIKYNTQHCIRDFKVGIKTPVIPNATFNLTSYYPGYTPEFGINHQNIPYSFTSSDVKEKIWVENQQVGNSIYFYYPNGADPFVKFPSYIKSISGKVWIRGFESESNAYVINEGGCS